MLGLKGPCQCGVPHPPTHSDSVGAFTHPTTIRTRSALYFLTALVEHEGFYQGFFLRFFLRVFS